MYTVYVVLYNSYGMELSRHKCEDMEEAREYAVAMLRGGLATVEVGDRIHFEEIEV